MSTIRIPIYGGTYVDLDVTDLGGNAYRLVVDTGGSSGGGTESALTTTQNALSTGAEQAVPANAARRFAEVKNTDAAINIYLGKDVTVSASTGHLLRPGEAFGFAGYVGAIWAVAASGTPTITTIEW